MVLDGHIHIHGRDENRSHFMEQAGSAGVSGGIVISEHPRCFERGGGDPAFSTEARLDCLFARTRGSTDLYPFFWIDPMERDAGEQVREACNRGVMGFKVICGQFYPYDDRPMEIFRAIARAGKPILFHSGILWDGMFSSPRNRPVGFEALIEIEGLRFSLAHASWPWCDECIALYGKFQNAQGGEGGATAEMFIDITPGTPEIYRRELLTKLFTVGYDVENNVVFGTDNLFDTYTAEWTAKWAALDRSIYEELKLSEAVVDKVFAGNLRRFVGVDGGTVRHRALTTTG